MKIEAYRFGSISIDGTAYESDLKIIEGRVVPGWWRKEGHNLLLVDIEDILEAGPEVLIVGQGDPGLMKVSGEV
ncbi:MAG: MTH938/NDUFAF3 family protein, partial [bacterium]